MRGEWIGALVVLAWACSDTRESPGVGELDRLGAFDDNITREQLFVQGAAERVFRDLAYDTLWIYGGSADTVLAAPIGMAAAPGGGVYVLDARMRKVYRIADGNLVWSWGAVGSGPGEIQNIRAMDADPETGGVVLVDSGNRRLVLLSSDGQLLLEAPIAVPSRTFSTVAALEGGYGYVVGTTSVIFPAIHVSSDGQFVRELPAPWDGFRSKNFLQVTGSAFGVGGGTWGFAFETGNGWFVYSSIDVDSAKAYPYVEHVDFPEVVTSKRSESGSVRVSAAFATRPTYSGYDVKTKADTLFVLAGGSAKRENLDVYMVSNGRYVETRSLPGQFTRFALAGDTVFVIDLRGLSPVILSLHPKEENPK